jgi:hypothetical protein
VNGRWEFLSHQEVWIIQKRFIKRLSIVAVLQLMVVVYSQAMFLMIVSNGNSRMHGTRGQEVSVAQSNIAALDEQRLESAWLQAAEKHTSVMLNQARPERNQILPQGGGQHCGRSSITTVVPSRQIDKDLTDELKALKISDSHGPQKGQNTQTENGYAISPSLLHRNNHLANCDNESV